MAGLAGFAALEAAVFVRYTDIVVLGCAVVAMVVAWRLRAVPVAALGWWLGSVAVFGVGVALFGWQVLIISVPVPNAWEEAQLTQCRAVRTSPASAQVRMKLEGRPARWSGRSP